MLRTLLASIGFVLCIWLGLPLMSSFAQNPPKIVSPQAVVLSPSPTSIIIANQPSPINITSGQLHTDLTSAQSSGANRIGFTTPQADTTGGCTWAHFASAVSTNSTIVSTGAHTLCGFEIITTVATLADFRLYDSATLPTCSSGTGVVGNYPVQSNAISPGMSIPMGFAGRAFSNGLAFCLTALVSDSDSNNTTTGMQINIGYK